MRTFSYKREKKMKFDMNGFFSKWGFQDGDMDDLDKFTYDDERFMGSVSSRELFNLIVKRNLLPVIKNKIEYFHVKHTCHN